MWYILLQLALLLLFVPPAADSFVDLHFPCYWAFPLRFLHRTLFTQFAFRRWFLLYTVVWPGLQVLFVSFCAAFSQLLVGFDFMRVCSSCDLCSHGFQGGLSQDPEDYAYYVLRVLWIDLLVHSACTLSFGPYHIL